ncbi:hypothetical protein GDO81_030193 [Engystomops pustulosus]|uniref:Uncharacterized protein n=1 Tax=Engystomops pustulosus TaxID=76066 RepID=A0AAV6YIL1_ENGPU|nr:hypothetical protein GDO81_030193 [Engystomops pustulosus]
MGKNASFWRSYQPHVGLSLFILQSCTFPFCIFYLFLNSFVIDTFQQEFLPFYPLPYWVPSLFHAEFCIPQCIFYHCQKVIASSSCLHVVVFGVILHCMDVFCTGHLK